MTVPRHYRTFYESVTVDELEKSRHSREVRSRLLKQRNPAAFNFLKRMDSRLRTLDYNLQGQSSGVTIMGTCC